MSQFFDELKRRNVFRVGIAYLVVAWLLLQVADLVLENIPAPDWVMQVLLLLVAVGLPFALFFAWVFEMTPAGIKREKDVDRSQSMTPQTGRKLDYIIIGVLAVALIVLGVERMFFASNGESDIAADSQIEKTIAVLPFSDLSQNQDQEWFADGLAEEILNALTRTPDLLVASRTSAFSYKGTDKNVPTIAAELGVAHILEGSVRRTGERLRVTAQLIRAADGFHLWSQNYDRDAADVIDIQEDLALQIATALETTMDSAALANMIHVGTRSVEAYLEYIHGIETRARAETDVSSRLFFDAYEHFERARSIDPDFWAAHRAAAFFWQTQQSPSYIDAGLMGLEAPQMLENYRTRINLAIATAPNEIDRGVTQAEKALTELRLRTAVRLYRAYVAVRPNDLDAWNSLLSAAEYASDMETIAQVLEHLRTLGETNEIAATYYVYRTWRYLDRNTSAEYGLTALERWPDSRGLMYETHRALLWAMRIDEAAALAKHFENRQDPFDLMIPARQACAEGRGDELLTIISERKAAEPIRNNVNWLLLRLIGDEEGAIEEARRFESTETPYALATLLYYPYFDPSPFPALMQALEREGVKRSPPVEIPFACPPEYE